MILYCVFFLKINILVEKNNRRSNQNIFHTFHTKFIEKVVRKLLKLVYKVTILTPPYHSTYLMQFYRY